MKTFSRLLLILLISTFMLSACKKTANEDNSLLMLLLGGSSAGTFTKKVELTTTTSSQGGTFSTAAFRHHQILYKPGDLTGSGNVRSIFFRYNTDSPAISCPNVTIKLGHTDATDLGAVTTNMGLNINQGEGSAVTVLDNKTVPIPEGLAGDYFEIPLDTQFHYNGFNNLVVDVLRTTACSDDMTLLVGTGSAAYTSMAWSTNDAAPDTTTNVSTYIHHMKFKFSGGDSTIFPNATTNNTIPFDYDTPAYNRVQMLFTPSEINGSGTITGIAYGVEAITAELEYTINVRIGHTSLSELALTTWDGNFTLGTPVTVVENAILKVPAGIPNQGYVWLPLTKSFNYNGTDNLIVETNVITHDANMNLKYLSGGTNTRAWGSSGSAGPGSRGGGHYNIKLRFKGSTMDVIGAPSGGGANVFSLSTTGRQFLLRSAELGTSGSINKIALQLADTDSVAASYPNFTVVLAHTTQTALVATDANNVAGGTVVYSGTFNLPVGLLIGDWIEIPLSTPFSYNGIDNLVVQTTTEPGTANHWCARTLNDTLFLNRYKITGGGAPSNYRGVLKFWVNK